MSSATAVLYDHPGPKAKLRNNIITVIFLLILAYIVYYVVDTLNDKGQLTAEKWEPFLTGNMWTQALLPGIWNTLKAAFLSVVIALPIGAIFGIARLSDQAWIRVPAGVVVEFFRAIPVLVLMIFANGVFVAIFGFANALTATVAALVLYNMSVLAEVFRSGILSLPRGQSEASLAIGMSKSQMMTIVLLPQAITAMLPAIVSQLVVILKDTALAGIFIGLEELRRAGAAAASSYKNLVPMYIVIALLYIAMNLALTSLASVLEKRGRRKRGGRRTPMLVETGDGGAGLGPGPNPTHVIVPASNPEDKRNL